MKTTIRCKFKCTDVINNNEDGSMIRLEAVTSGSPENDLYFNYTPYGVLSFGMIKQNVASSVFETNKEYYIDIIPSK